MTQWRKPFIQRSKEKKKFKQVEDSYLVISSPSF